ncbi:MAG: 2-dehydropantoate 2-reductase, partial [Calditrichota bacterium]
MGLNLGICGVGSLASLFAAKLASLGSDSPVRVHMIGNWEDQIQHINQHGLSLISATDSIKDIRVSALHWQDCPQLDIAIVLNKSYQTEATAKYLANRMSKSGLVITLQNGLGNTDVLKSYIDCKVLSGLTSEAANRPRLGAVVHAGTGKTIIESSMHPLMATLLNILVRAGFDVESSSRIENEIWNKLLINIAINPLTAIFDIKNGQLLEDDVLISVACDAAVEVAAVANKLGLPIADIESTIKSVCRNTAENHSSMLQDIKSGRETEIDSLCGAVVRYGEKLDV